MNKYTEATFIHNHLMSGDALLHIHRDEGGYYGQMAVFKNGKRYITEHEGRFETMAALIDGMDTEYTRQLKSGFYNHQQPKESEATK